MEKLNQISELEEYKENLNKLNNERLDTILKLKKIEADINLLKWSFKKQCVHVYETQNNYKKCKHCGNLT